MTRIQTVRDQLDTRIAGMTEALVHRLNPRKALSDNGAQYRSLGLLEIGREFLEAHGVSTRGVARSGLVQDLLQFRSGGMHATSDFASLLANVAHKRLRDAYEEGAATYTRWARRGPDAPDFREINVTQLSGAPSLLQTNEHGEFKYGSLSSGKETYSVITYGRIVGITRQALVNDDLRAFDRLILAFAASSRRLENGLVYSQLTANGNLSDGGALFNATAVSTSGGHANLASGGGSALSATSLGTARAAMRAQKGLQSETLNLSPAFLLVPAALEQLAYQYTSPNYVPATSSAVNEFRTGGRTALEPVVEPLLDVASSTAWYLAAHTSQIDTVEYCYLDGLNGPVIETKSSFGSDGVSFRARLDFAAKAIDFRGLYKSAGA